MTDKKSCLARLLEFKEALEAVCPESPLTQGQGFDACCTFCLYWSSWEVIQHQPWCPYVAARILLGDDPASFVIVKED